MNTKAARDTSGRSRRPLGATFYKYVAREAIRPALFALLGLTAVILTKDLLGYSDLIINRGLSVRTVGAMALFQAAPIAALMFPFAVLLGCLVAMGRLGADREILTLEASGVPAARLTLPLIVFAAFMTVVSLYFSMVASPWSHRSLDSLLQRVKTEKPWSQMRQGEVAEFAGWRVEAREVSSRGDRLENVLMWMPDVGETTFARSGIMEADESGSVQIRLRDASILLSANKNPRMLRFDAMTAQLPDDDGTPDEHEPKRTGMPLEELANAGSRNALTEYHRRFALPAATLIFGLLAGPLILIRRNFSRASGSVLGIALTLTYYALTQLGEGLIQGKQASAAFGVWLPNGILGLLAIYLLFRAMRTNSLGHAFDRPQRKEKKVEKEKKRIPARAETAPGYRPRRYPLPRYIAGRFLQLAFLTFAVMMVAYLLINVMERLDWFAKHGATGDEILRYYAARLPLLASRVVPMSMLVATALTISVLAAEGELIGMRSCGIPAPRALLPVFVFAALMVPTFFALSDIVVPRSNALANDVKENEIKNGGAGEERGEEEDPAEMIWYRAGNQVIEAELFDPKTGQARKLVVYHIGDDGHPTSRIDALSARHVGGGEWRLNNATMVEVTANKLRRVSAPRYANLGAVLPAEVSTRELSVSALSAEIVEMESAGFDAVAYRVDRHVKLAQPLACFILPALVLFFAVGGPPFPGPAQNLLVSIVVGVSYLLATGISASFGYGGTISPALGGWAPNIGFALTAAFFGLRLWRRM